MLPSAILLSDDLDNGPVWVQFVLLVALATLFFVFLKNSKRRSSSYLKGFDGPKGLPVLGNALSLQDPEEIVSTFYDWEKMYGLRLSFSMGLGTKFVSLSAPKDLEKLLTSSEHIEKGILYDILKVGVGDGILVMGGSKWHKRRKLLTPAFHFKILEQFQRTFDVKIKKAIKMIGRKVSKGEDVMEVHQFFAKFALDSICETAMGKHLNCLDDPDQPFVAATMREAELLCNRWFTPWLWPDFLWSMSAAGREESVTRKKMDDFIQSVIRERREMHKNQGFYELVSQQGAQEEDDNLYMNSKKKFAFLDLLLHCQATGEGNMTDEDLRGEVSTFLTAGHDTTSYTLTWAIFILGQYPQHQALICEEIDRVLGHDPERKITAADLSELKHLDICIKECMRLYPTVPLIARQLRTDFEMEQGMVIPKGTIVIGNFYNAFHNEESFPKPFEYIPERFSADNLSTRSVYAYTPFSAGPRNCIGQRYAMMEVKTVLATIFRYFTVITLDKPEDVKFVPYVTLKPTKDLRIKFTPRENSRNLHL